MIFYARLSRLIAKVLHRIWASSTRGLWATIGTMWNALLGGALIAWTGEHWGPGATTDGLTYLILARNLYRFGAAGFVRPGPRWEPVTLWPPGYPLSITSIMYLGSMDETTAAWILNIGLIMFLVVLVGREVYVHTRHPVPTWLLSLSVALAYPVLRMYAWIRAENLFLVLLLLISWAQERWRHSNTVQSAMLTALLVVWAVAVRWIGVALLPWIGLVQFWHMLYDAPRRPSPRTILVFGLVAGGGIGALFWASRMASGSVAQRQIAWHPPTLENWLRAAQSINEWFSRPFQDFTPSMLAIRAALAIILAIVWLSFTYRRVPALRLFILRWSVWIGVYMSTLVLSITLVAPQVWMKQRLLLPVYLPLLWLMGVTAWQMAQRHWWGLVVLIFLTLLHFRTAKAYDSFYLRLWHNRGAVWRAATVQTADLWKIVRALPPDVLIYTNQERVLYYYTDRPSFSLEGKEPSDLAANLRNSCAVIVLVGEPHEDPRVLKTIRALEPYFPVGKNVDGGHLRYVPGFTCSSRRVSIEEDFKEHIP